MQSQREIYPHLKLSLSTNSFSSTHLNLSDCTFKRDQFLSRKQNSSSRISDVIDKQYFSCMLDLYESKNHTIPNPVEVIEKVRLLQRKLYHDFSQGNIPSLYKKTQKNHQELNPLTPKDPQTTQIRNILCKFIEQMKLSQIIQLDCKTPAQMVQSFLSCLKHINQRQNYNKHDQLIKLLEQTQQKNKYLREELVRTKASSHEVALSQQPIDCQQFKQRTNLAINPRVRNSYGPNLIVHSEQTHQLANSFIQIRVDSETTQINELDEDKEQRYCLENSYKQLLDNIQAKYKVEKENLAAFWKDYMVKVVEEYQKTVDHLKKELEESQKLIVLYQREINKANSYVIKVNSQAI